MHHRAVTSSASYHGPPALSACKREGVLRRLCNIEKTSIHRSRVRLTKGGEATTDGHFI